MNDNEILKKVSDDELYEFPVIPDWKTRKKKWLTIYTNSSKKKK
jgi:hypothetical protein